MLSSSLYSETACAMAAGMADAGHVPVGVLSLRTWDHRILIRKLGQWGIANSARYARKKLMRGKHSSEALHNPYLAPFLANHKQPLKNLHDVAKLYRFPVATCSDQNSKPAIAQLRRWSPDVVVFAGGNILRQGVLDLPRLGVINVHLGRLPEIRGMSSPEWSLLRGVPVGITIHYMDSGIDTGRILLCREFPDTEHCHSLEDLRNQLIAFGVRQLTEVLSSLDRGTISAQTQSQLDQDNQFFVIHERLRMLASERLATLCTPAVGAEVA
jgi:folate-dependent phosphoribosylglycinamide formyltransferase PurN